MKIIKVQKIQKKFSIIAICCTLSKFPILIRNADKLILWMYCIRSKPLQSNKSNFGWGLLVFPINRF